MYRIIAAALLLALAPAPVWAGKIKSVTTSAPGHYDKAQFQQTVVSSEGRITLARWLKPLVTKAALDAARVWDVVEDKAGNLFAATGDDGKVFKITPDGQVSLAFKSDDSQVLCLLATADGSIYAGTGPGGLIIHIDPAGQGKTFAKTAATYVWALAADEKDGTLFAATGPRGRVYRVSPGVPGKADVFFECKQDHVLSLARAADGTLYAGTDKQGLVYRIDARGKGFVLFQAAQAEARCLQLTADALYVGTSSPSGPSRSGSSGGSPPGPAGVGAAGRKGDAERASTGDKEPAAPPPPRDERRDGERPAGAAPGAAGNGENSVYRVGLDGSAREIFREKGLVLSLLKVQDRLYVGTGSKGQLFEVNETTRERSEIARLDGGQINRLFKRRDGGILLATGDPGKLYVLQDRFAASGTLTSEVIDARLISRWGALSWQGETPARTKLTIAVRAGNVAEPDDTWTDWSAEQADPKTAVAKVPPARYLQYRVTLATENPNVSPSLHQLTLRYATLNQAPEVTNLDVPSAESIASSKEPKKLKFRWNATDPNDDELAFDLYVKKDAWKDWVRVEEGWTKTEYEWDTTTMPSGEYRFKVVASDRTDNNESDVLTGERTSAPVPVAHEAPAVMLKMTGIDKNRAVFEASASSNLVRLTGATYALDGGKWHNLFPADGLFDGREEKFKFTSETLAPGTHVMVLRLRDAAGNTGSADVVFTVQSAEK